MKKILRFPDKFLWGASTSAHQVEGNNTNDWSEWEKENAERLARQAEKNFSKKSPVWEKIKEQAQNPDNYISGFACNHYQRFEEDFDIAQMLGLKALRFSIEWSRIEEDEGKFKDKEISHYKKVLFALKKREIEPFVTLWHWPVPLWLKDKGGWKSKTTVNYFSRYVEKVVRSLKNQVTFWITLNEPEIYAYHSYWTGEWPPQEKSFISNWVVIKNLIMAHKRAYRIIKRINPSALVGIAKHNIYFHAFKNGLINRLIKRLIDWRWNFYFLNKTIEHLDYIGLNYYLRDVIYYGLHKNENKIVSDLGWELFPEGIYYVLKDLKKYKKPIYITENGLADAEDSKRDWFIKEILKNIHRAIKEKIDVRGYLHWSLLDNFEWDKGFWPRFGLVEVDYFSLQRKIRNSARKYAEIIEKNAI